MWRGAPLVEGRRLSRFSLSGVLSCAVVVICTATCGDGGATGLDPVLEPIAGEWYRPGVAVTWQWQLQGIVNTTYEVDLYDIDLFDTPATLIASLQASGKRVICYFSAGSFEAFRPDAAGFRPLDLGNPLDGFPDERWLDIRSASVLAIMRARLDMARGKGCDGVEPDNMDGYTNDTGFNITAGDQLTYNRTIANEAHERGLSVGLKNDLDQVSDLIAFFDFQVNEQCHEFDECDALDGFIAAGKPVFNAEYDAQWVSSGAARAQLCAAARARDFRTLVMPLGLDDSFRFSCDS